MQYAVHLGKKIRLLFRIAKSVYWINQFNDTRSSYHRQGKKMTMQLLSAVDLKNTPQFPPIGKLKMQWYMAESIFTCEQMNRLMGRASALEDRRNYLLAGAMLTMSDLLIDDVEMDMERVKLLKKPGRDFTPKDEIEKLYLLCYHQFFDSLKDPVKARALEYFECLFDAQIKSKDQFNSNITQEQVDVICKDKCGYSTLFLRSLINEPCHNEEKLLWFELGGLVQFSNDAQDMHKDLMKGIRTFGTVRPDMESIKRDLEAQRTLVFTLIKNAPFDVKKKDDFLLLFYVMYAAIQAKLFIFETICGGEFSPQRLLSITSEQLRNKVSAVRLLKYVVPDALNYRYDTV